MSLKEIDHRMNFALRLALVTATAIAGISGCKKDSSSLQGTFLGNKSLNEVLEAINGRWKELYLEGNSTVDPIRISISDTVLGHYTSFYADHITYANEAGDSSTTMIKWQRVDYDGNSLYAFLGLVANPDRENGFAVLSIVNDTLRIGSIEHGPDSGVSYYFKKD